ncbi:MAG: response regulator [Deltaproteobacteria bacterium]|nr:response regulator [Deltaproteobacteria bacterium]
MPNKTILFTDDSETMRQIMTKAFAVEPYDVITVPSGEAAIMKARELKPAIVIADAGMAGVTGYDVCKAVRQDPALGQTPVIIMSGVSNPYDEARGKEVGATEHVRKPFDTAQLIEKVGMLTAVTAARPLAATPVPPAPRPSMPIAAPRPLTEKPMVAPAPPGPIVSPIVSAPPASGTMEFGRPSVRPVQPRPMPVQASQRAPERREPEPIELGPQDETHDEGQFHVGTLAELAQMDHKARPLEHVHEEEAIDLTIETKPKPIVPAPVAAVRREAVKAGADVAAQVGGLTAEQAAAIQALTADVVERVVWEVVPDLAETIIREELAKLLKE